MPPQRPTCCARRCPWECPSKSTIWIVTVILSYVLVAATVAALVINVVDGHHFSTSSKQQLITKADGKIEVKDFFVLKQSDVTTLVSLSSTLVRVIGACCCGIASWHVTFMMLEKTGMSLSQLSSMGTSSPFIRSWPQGTAGITIILSLIFTSHEAYSAILNGSITWKPATSYATNLRTVDNISLGDLKLWKHHAVPDQRRYTVNRALGYITTAAAGSRVGLWRVVDSASSVPINSTLSNITLPFFVIDSFEWVMDPAGTLDSATLNATNAGSRLLNYTSPSNPMQQEAVGILALIPHTDMLTSPPEPSVVSGSDYYVALTAGWYSGADLKQECSAQPNQWWPSLFNFMPPDIRYYPTPYQPYPGAYHCIAFARVSFRAGAGICKNCRVISRSVVQNDSEIELQEDLMTRQALSMMPEVSVALAMMNATLPLPAEGMDRYITNALTQSYAGSWTALTDYFGQTSERLSTSVRVSVQASEAHVDRMRVIIWLSLNVLIATVCATAVRMQFRGCRRRVLLDRTLSALLLDATEVANHLSDRRARRGAAADSYCVCNTSSLSSDEKNLVVKMDAENAGHEHYKIVPKLADEDHISLLHRPSGWVFS